MIRHALSILAAGSLLAVSAAAQAGPAVRPGTITVMSAPAPASERVGGSELRGYLTPAIIAAIIAAGGLYWLLHHRHHSVSEH